MKVSSWEKGCGSWEIHRMQLPREVLVGRGVLRETGSMCRTLGFGGIAVGVIGPRILGMVSKELEESLKKVNMDIEYVIVHEASISSVSQVEERIERARPSIVLGIGGGKDIDVAKLSSARKGVPFISIPTAASHDGIASAHSSIKGTKQPFSIKGQTPIAIIADIAIISHAPYRLTASGCGDIVAKYTAVKDWKLASRLINEYYGEYAADLALMSAKLVMKSARNIREQKGDAIRTVVEALISCGVAMSIAGSSRPCSGSEHLFVHALDLITPNNALHGEKCAVGTILCACLQDRNWKVIKKVLKTIGAPTTADELGVGEKDIIEALVRAREVRPDRYTVLNIRMPDHKRAKEIARVTGVI